MTPKAADGANFWQVNLLGGLKPLLFGGSAVASFQLEHGDTDDGCRMTEKGALCPIVGPAKLKVQTKQGHVISEAFAGERAQVEMRGTKISCRDEQ